MASPSKPRTSLRVVMSRLPHLYTALDLLTGISTYTDTEDLLTGISYIDTGDLRKEERIPTLLTKVIKEWHVEDQTVIKESQVEDQTVIKESQVEDQTLNKLPQTKTSLQVYVSFRGVDVRKTFVGHLCRALDLLTGILPYVDSEELRKGEAIASSLAMAIKESQVAIIIFSEDFASSVWCLEELSIIMECNEQNGLIVWPVFYNVEPKEVRAGRESYRRAIVKHESKFGKDSEKVKQWKKALFDAGSLSGWELNDGCEATLIEEIAKYLSELKRFDVFLSFRGKDVRENFVKSLNKALVQKGINTFMDSENLVMGEDFPPALKDAIEKSRMYVVVFSKNYAGSWWCLKELVQILERKNRKKQLMLPIFYQVEPGELRRQKQSYGKALAKHEIEYGKRKVNKWREALSEAANVNGMHLPDGNRDGSIPSIVEKIEKMMAEIRRKLG